MSSSNTAPDLARNVSTKPPLSTLLSQRATINFSQQAESSAQLESQIPPSQDISCKDGTSSFRSISLTPRASRTAEPFAKKAQGEGPIAGEISKLPKEG
jgi:hypothetical protein